MCLNPIKINNPTLQVRRAGGQKLRMEVPCGKCADCKKNKRLEWHFRTYHEVNSCVNNGGYVLFDTLTYSEDNVPHISDFIDIKSHGITDFTCFNADDWRKFIKNLRRQLDYHYPGITFKYFITSEYGTKEGCTHRPHYHPLFFVNSRSMDPYEFSRLISKCWQKGRTDGIPYQSRDYVAEHVVGFDLGQESPNDFLKVSSYISKYITKDSTFQKVINSRIDLIKKYCNPDELSSLLRCISQYSRCSEGFGISFIDNLSKDDYDYIFNNGCCKIKDGKKVVATIPLPLYYKRKLFFYTKKDDEGKIYYVPNSRGIGFIRKSLFRNIDNLATRYTDLYNNSSNVDKSYIDSLLNGRTLSDCAFYNVLFKHRSFDYDFPTKHYNLDVYIDDILSSYYIRTCAYTDIFNRDSDEPDKLYVDYNIIDYDTYITQHTFNQNSFPEFSNFDKLLSFLNYLQEPSNHNKQNTFDFIEELEKRFKLYSYV